MLHHRSLAMPPFHPRAAVSVLVVTTAFLGGMAFDELGHREARAQSLTTSTIVVPEGGLYFRAPDGTPVARLARDAHGGSFELFDEHSAGRAARGTKELQSNPYVDVEDPWMKAAPVGERPGAGF
jgi:hypothetical protein